MSGAVQQRGSPMSVSGPNRLLALTRVAAAAVPIFFLCGLSNATLTALGVYYVIPGGNPLVKIHPGTYVATAAVIFLYFNGSTQPIKTLLFNPRYRLALYFLGVLLFFMYGLILLDGGYRAMQIIDVWYLPGVILLLIGALTAIETRLLARAIDIFMVINSLLGLVEVATNWRLTPLTIWSPVLGQWMYPYEWRATALLGHPLTNSYVLGSYLVSLLITKRIPSVGVRLLLILLHTLALSAFGSRGASTFFVIALMLYVAHGLIHGAAVGRMAKDIIVYVGALVFTVVLLLPAVVSSGFADRYIERFTNDSGSSQARNVALDVITSYSFSDLILGPPVQLVFQVQRRYGIIALESFWLESLESYGLVGCALLFPMIFWLCRCMIRQRGAACGFVLVYFFACCSTAVSLGTKSVMMAIVVAICMTNPQTSPVRVGRSVLRPRLRPRSPVEVEGHRPVPGPPSGVPA